MGDLQSQQDIPLRPYGHVSARADARDGRSMRLDRLVIWGPAALGFVGFLVVLCSPMCAHGIVLLSGLAVLSLGLLLAPFALRSFRRTRARRRTEDTAGICLSGGFVVLALLLAVYLLLGALS